MLNHKYNAYKILTLSTILFTVISLTILSFKTIMPRSSSTLANETILTYAVCDFDKRDIGAVISDTTPVLKYIR